MFGICVFDISTKSGTKIGTRPIHILLIIAMIFGNILGLFAIGIGKLEKHRLFDHGLSGTVLFSIATIMASSTFLLMLFSLGNRRRQMSLLRKIDAFDRQMPENVIFHNHWRKHRNNFVSHIFVFVLYDVLLFISQIIFKYYDSIHLLLFFVFYSVSDVAFTAHTSYVIMYGRYLITRYFTLNQQLKIMLTIKRQPIRKRFSMLISLYEKLFRMQLLVGECFGSILLFTVAFHGTAVTVSTYVFINDISTHFEQFNYYVVAYVSWMLPYYVRIYHIASTFATVTSQVRLATKKIHHNLVKFTNRLLWQC